MSTHTVAMRLPDGSRVMEYIDAEDWAKARALAIVNQAARRPFRIPSTALVLIPKEDQK